VIRSTLLLTLLCLIQPLLSCSRPLQALGQDVPQLDFVNNQPAADQKYMGSVNTDPMIVKRNVSGQPETLIAQDYDNNNSVVLVTSRDATGVLYTFETDSKFDESRIELSNGVLRLTHFSTEGDYSYIEAQIPNGSGKVTVAARFGANPENLRLVLDGWGVDALVVTVGRPSAFGNYLKAPELAAGVDRYLVYASKISDLELNVASRWLAAKVAGTQVGFDQKLLDVTEPANEGGGMTNEFRAAKAVIDKNCLQCHGGGSQNGDFSNQTSAQFVQRSLIMPKNLALSPLYYRLKGASGGPGPRTMPANGQLSAADVSAIATWINSL
jgi:mono/diheme cytochrome c family protein